MSNKPNKPLNGKKVVETIYNTNLPLEQRIQACKVHHQHTGNMSYLLEDGLQVVCSSGEGIDGIATFCTKSLDLKGVSPCTNG